MGNREKRLDKKRKRRETRKDRAKNKDGRSARMETTSTSRRQIDAFATYLTLTELVGRSTPPSDLINLVRRIGWRPALARIALIAARLKQSPNEASREVLSSLAKLQHHPHPPIAYTASAAANYSGSSTLLHEQLIYFLEALVILEGAEEGPNLDEGELALWALITNEHLHNWAHSDSRPLTDLEAIVADLAHVSRFNVREDDLRSFTRAALMFERRPEHAKLGSDPARWSNLQTEAYGKPFSEVYRTLIGPLVLASASWGSINKDGSHSGPRIDIDTWAAQTKLDQAEVESFLLRMSVNRAMAREELAGQRRADGLPHAPSLFYRKPFITLDPGVLMAASPWVVREHLRAGIWFRFSEAATELGYDRDDWPSAFGHLFELWCQGVARMASASPRFKEEVLLPSHPGASDEIEDVVTYDGDAACLFSAKGKLVTEAVARRALDRAAVIDWYEEFFFGPPGKKQDRAYRHGAVRLLDEKITTLRAGKFEEKIRRDARVFPVLLSFDNLGETPVLNRWLRGRCAEEGLLQQNGVAPLALLRVDRFEELMALAAQGTPTTRVLARKASREGRDRNMDKVIYEFGRGRALRLNELEEKFQRIFEDVTDALFGNHA